MRWDRPVGIWAAIVIVALGADDPVSPPNLLVDGSFEEKTTAGWSAGSWRVPVAEVKIDDSQAHEGSRSATLRIEGFADDARVVRKLRVVPDRRYRASGWVKTSAVVPGEPQATVGANLGLFQRPERSESLFGDHDWTELSFDFESGAASEVEFAARLGFFSSIVTGQAWFDDLRVVDIGPASAGLTPSPTPATDDQGPIPAAPVAPIPPGPVMHQLWIYAALALGLPLLLSSVLMGLAWLRKWKLRVTASWLVGASVALAVIGFVTSQVIWVPALATFLIAVTLFLVPSTGSDRLDGLDSAPGEVGAAAKSVQFGARHLAPLIFSLTVLVGSSWFVSMVIFSLLAIPVMLGGAIAVGLALVCIPGPSKSSVSGPSKWLGSLMILLGSAGMMVILFTMSSMLGGRRSPDPGETRTILAITGGGWLAVVGIIAVGLGLRGSDTGLRRNVCWILLATLVLALGFGSMIWPILPKSL